MTLLFEDQQNLFCEDDETGTTETSTSETVIAGWGACSCGCGAYVERGDGYCTCGHDFSAHM